LSPNNYRTDKLSKNEARKQIQSVVSKYPRNVWFSRHALDELFNDELTTADAINVLKSSSSKIYEEGELEKGSYRYRLETSNIVVVVAFSEDGMSITVITAWDKRRK
jgi:hypothetical protein